MVLVNVTVFVVLKILHNFVSIQKSLFANNCWSKQNYEKCAMWDFTFIFIELSETNNSFLKKRCAL